MDSLAQPNIGPETMNGEHLCHLSSCDRDPLVGFTCVRGPATGDLFQLTVHCLTNVYVILYSFVVTFTIIQASDRITYE